MAPQSPGFTPCRLVPAEASQEQNLLKGQHGGQGYSFDEGTAAIMWACPEFFRRYQEFLASTS